MAVIHASQYGINEILGYKWTGKNYTRIDRFTSHSGETETRQIFCTGNTDTSRHQSTYPTGYDSRCSCCFLNFTHTEEYHKQSIATAQR